MPAIFVDAESMLVDFLRARIAVPVSTRVPNPRPTRFIRAWRTGGTASSRVLEQAQITVTCEAPNTVQASEDATFVRNVLHNEYTAMPLVRGIEEVAGPYFDPDPDTGAARHSMTVLLRIRGRR